VFLPAVRPLLALAATMEEERGHAVRRVERLPEDVDLERAERVESEPGPGITALEASAEFAHVLHGGRAIVAGPDLTVEDEDFIGLPGLLTAEQTASLLAVRDARLRGRRSLADELDQATDEPTWRDADGLRREVHALVGRLAGRTQRPHAQVHAEVRRAVPGPPSGQAPYDILQARRDWLLGRVG
jgi:hypothetical protein